MRATPLALAVFLAFTGSSLARTDQVAPAEKSQQRGVYLVEFVEPALSSFRGRASGLSAKFDGLKATSPAVTGARRLDVSAPASVAYRAALADVREDRLARAGARVGRVLEPLFVYDVVSNGVAVELSAEEARALAKVDGVLRVEPEFISRPMTDAGPQWINANALWNGTAGTATRGEGVVVGVIDSGINRTHPSFAGTGPQDAFPHTNPKGRLLGRCAEVATAGECNSKLIGIHDFTIGQADAEANDGLDNTGHGSHVASTAAGNVFTVNVPVSGGVAPRVISGVAPHANVIMYKACERVATCHGSWLLASINQAVADGVDVINYSIGGSARDPWVASDSLAMLGAREAGVVVVVAAGNDGPDSGSVTSPGDAPWVITAANATHDRAVVSRLVDLSGGATAPPQGGVLVGAGNTAGYGPRPLVMDPLFPLCGTGIDLDSGQSGRSNPWPVGRFNGEIVLCDRGVQARVAKSNNVRLAGGGGMVLMNTAAEGEGVVADPHTIPSTHLGFVAGSALKAWMATGSGHQGRIEGARIDNVPALGDVLSSSSGRGPVLTGGVLKPDFTAPGSNVLAASQTGVGGTFLSGTSMATPHIACASALLIAARPNWTPSQVESALLTTARDSVRLPDGSTPAGPFDEGSGAADVGKALGAGLYLDTTTTSVAGVTDYRDGNPASGGDPRKINRPSLVDHECFERCTLTRRVTDLVGGASWRVEVDLPSPAGATLSTPTSFTLAAGQSADVTLTFDVTDSAFPGSWVHGRLKLIRTGGAAAANAEMPISLFASPGPLPGKIDLQGAGESGFQDISLGNLVALPQAGFSATAIVAPVRTDQALVQDATRDDRYDSFGVGTFFTTVRVPAGSTPLGVFKLVADTRSATAYDVDLFVGEDVDNDGAPDSSEMLCESTGQFATEHCEIDVAQRSTERVYWVLAQNWDAGAQGGDAAGVSDIVTLETALVDLAAANDAGLVATGPGNTDSRETFRVRLAWDDPGLLPGERRVGYLRLAASDAKPGQVGLIPVEVKRNVVAENAPAVLTPSVLRRMRLAAGAAQERLYIDVPPNATALTVSSSGSGEVDLYVARVATPGSPVIASAPARGMASATSIHPGASEALTVTGAALQPGRWYVTPVNAGTTSANFDLTATLQFGSSRPVQKFGAYYNPARSGAGLFLFPANGGSVWSLVWYTYLQDGTPTWYLGVATAPTAQNGVWRVTMDRYSWDGNANFGTSVGEAQLAFTDATNFTFSWNLDGESGSEPMSWIDGGACAQLNGAPAAITGMWYSPAKEGFGYAINAYPTVESNALYFYDSQGVARWALGTSAPFGSTTLSLSQYDGFCPLCTHKVPPTVEIGNITRRYDNPAAGNIAVNLQLRPPMTGAWNVDLPAVRLTDALQCP